MFGDLNSMCVCDCVCAHSLEMLGELQETRFELSGVQRAQVHRKGGDFPT